jgi:predicted cupin superfamily sugar epimerase
VKSELMQSLGMQAHPEGGAFVETYRSNTNVRNQDLFERPASTGIYFLLGTGEFSAFHRIKSDEMWHFYSGDPLMIFEISEDGQWKETIVGSNWREGQLFQYVVPAGAWFASQPLKGTFGYSLVGCTVAPGFDFADFELASCSRLIQEFPQHEKLIRPLTRIP